jgi:hypothetical protein
MCAMRRKILRGIDQRLVVHSSGSAIPRRERLISMHPGLGDGRTSNYRTEGAKGIALGKQDSAYRGRYERRPVPVFPEAGRRMKRTAYFREWRRRHPVYRMAVWQASSGVLPGDSGDSSAGESAGDASKLVRVRHRTRQPARVAAY